jgi:phosphoenolpyruvate carboxylase
VLNDPIARQRLRLEGFELIDETLGFLIGCLGDALEQLGEKELLPYLPWCDQAAPGGEPPEGIQQLYSIGFQLLNMVEERVAAAIRREREKELGATSIRGLWPQALRDMKEIGLKPEEILQVLADVDVQPVLTAHPTEAKRASVRERHRALYDELVRYEFPKFTSREKRRIRDRIVTALQTLWRTGEIHLTRPDIFRELRDAIHYLRDLFPAALDRLDLHFTEAWRDAGYPLNMLRAAGNIPHLSFGTWIGGDRDGHPLVTPEVTEKTLQLLRRAAFQLLRRGLNDLSNTLTLSEQLNDIPAALTQRIAELCAVIPEPLTAEIFDRYSEEPWRQLAALMMTAISQSVELDGTLTIYQNPEQIDADLALIAGTVKEGGCDLIVEQHVRPLRHKLQIFGFHLATLDVRQNSEFHDQAIAQLLHAAGIADGENYAQWEEDRRVDFLSKELQSARPFLHDSASVGEQADLVLRAYRVVAAHRRAYGSAGIGALIVSMTRQVSDLLGVHVLAREAGLMNHGEEGLWCPLEIVPLFETMDDLDRAPQIMEAYLSQPIAKRSIRMRHAVCRGFSCTAGPMSQQIMLGYSDSNKDCGILAAQWALHRAETRLTSTAQRFDLHFRYFHGRGGTISRGAGPTHWFMASLPHGSMSGGFRMTEQGETIAQKYANLANATYHLELLLAGAAITTARHKHLQAPHQDDDLAAILDHLAQSSTAAYQEFLRKPGFIDFYRQATPIDALENARIGSRPARRTGKKGHSIADLRAIPWVFSWTQARFYLPGWFGVGSALAALQEEQPQQFAALKNALPHSPFVAYLFTNVETNLHSANRTIMKSYAHLVKDETLRATFMDLILAEFERTARVLGDLFDGGMETRRPRMAKTLAIRDEPLAVLHRQQVVLLQEWRDHLAKEDHTAAERILPKLLLSINAIASGLRTTG